MPLTSGTRVGPYEILEPIGAGGMGEVSKARDTRLDRIVAIKISSERFSDRFEREARAIAALSHPNICTLFDVGSTPEGAGYLVMEYIEGETLADRIAQGAISLSEALPLIRQIADALDAAHERGITHRDLKPPNIKIKPDGSVKVLDFGLAKLTHPIDSGSMSGTPANSPTLTLGMTNAGMVLGTAAYMAPEQARGKTVDKRADIWSFGVVLYEMVTGNRLFAGEDVAHTLAAVIMQEPDYSAAAPELRPLFERCLEKDPRKRLRDIADAVGLIDIGVQLAASRANGGAPPTARSAWMPRAGWLAAGLLALVAGWASWRAMQPAAGTDDRLLRLEISPPGEVNVVNFTGSAISPDGRRLAFVSRASGGGPPRLFVRALDSLDAREIQGSEEAQRPFWSPDSKTIAFIKGDQLMRVDAAAGNIQRICSALGGGSRGGTWNDAGVILFASGEGGIQRVTALGGDAARITTVDRGHGENAHFFPYFLPDGKHFLYYRRRMGAEANTSGIYIGTLDDPKKGASDRLLVATSYRGVYGAGFLITQLGENLVAQPFDPSTLRLSGQPQPIADRVQGSPRIRWLDVSMSQTGLLAYGGGGGDDTGVFRWRDRSGKLLGEPGPAAFDRDLELTPDGRHALSRVIDGEKIGAWMLDLDRGTRSRIASKGDGVPILSPKGDRIASAEGNSIYLQRLDSAGEPRRIDLGRLDNVAVSSWSNDDRLVFSAGSGGQQDLYDIPLTGGQPELLVADPGAQLRGRISPDGHWLAYESDETGQTEAFLRRLGGATGKWQISSGGGSSVRWRADGKELIYVELRSLVMQAVTVQLSPNGVVLGKPVPLLQTGSEFDVTPDFQRALVVEFTAPAYARRPVVILQGWRQLLK